MKTVILAGGLGTRLMEETEARPKPMVEIGGKPILWHIMKIYENYGFNDFIICLGYKGTFIKQYFYNYFLHNSDVTIEVANNNIEVHYSNAEAFKVTLVDTGLHTNTAGRIKRIQKYVEGETFMMTYGDGVSDIDISELLDFHRQNGKLATLTSIQIPGRFGNIEMDDSGQVHQFQEKPQGDGMWINGGFFVLEPGVFDFLVENMDDVQWEKGPLKEITRAGQLSAYKHHGFWKCMDHLRDKQALDHLWESNKAAWRIWK